MVSVGCLKIRTEGRGLMHVLAVSGDLDAGTAGRFAKAVEQAAAHSGPRPARVMVDLSGVRSVDAAGARALAAAISPARGRCRVVLRSLRPALRQVVTAVVPDLDLVGSGLVMAHLGAAACVDPGSPTWTLERELRNARARARETITDAARAAARIAATEDRIAATLLSLAPRRPREYERLVALSQLARRHADRLRDLTGDAAAPRGDLGAAADRHDTAVGTVHRATAYMHEHARDDISAADIAAAASVTTRAVQLAFRRYLGMTPSAYLRRVRLEQAHRELLAAEPLPGTVTRVAVDWRFTSPSRFAACYRAAYGVLPSHTLHHPAPARSAAPVGAAPVGAARPS